MILLSKITLNTFLYGKVVSILWKSEPGAQTQFSALPGGEGHWTEVAWGYQILFRRT